VYVKASSSCRLVPLFVWGGLHKKNEKKLARSFNFTFCFIDNVLSLNNYRFGDFVELEVRNTTDTDRSVSYLDIHIEIDSERRLRTKLYDKRADFVSFRFSCEALLIQIKEQVGKKRRTLCTHRYADCLLKNTSPNIANMLSIKIISVSERWGRGGKWHCATGRAWPIIVTAN
jgi:hypothetical protein